MDDKKRNNIELYVFVGVVALIFFLGYDGFFNDSIKPNEGRGGWKSKLGGLLMWSIWKIGDEHPWAYILFRGVFLVIMLWVGYKIFKTIRKKDKKTE